MIRYSSDATFLFIQAYKPLSRPTRMSEIGPTSRFALEHLWSILVSLLPSERLFTTKSIYFSPKIHLLQEELISYETVPSQGSFRPCSEKMFPPPLDMRKIHAPRGGCASFPLRAIMHDRFPPRKSITYPLYT